MLTTSYELLSQQVTQRLQTYLISTPTTQAYFCSSCSLNLDNSFSATKFLIIL